MEQPSVAECINSSTVVQINANRQKLASLLKPLYFVVTKILLCEDIESPGIPSRKWRSNFTKLF